MYCIYNGREMTIDSKFVVSEFELYGLHCSKFIQLLISSDTPLKTTIHSQWIPVC